MKDLELRIAQVQESNSVFIDLDGEKEKIIEARMDLVRRYSEAKGTYNSKKEAYLKAKNDL